MASAKSKAKGAKDAKPFKCPECDYSAKTQGAVTQHINKQHTDDAVARLRNEFGDAAPRPGGILQPARPTKAAPSGIPSIDYAIGIGGVPRGRIVEVFGPPKIGKSFTALTFSAAAQQAGGRAGYLDVENAAQESFMRLVPGLDLEKLELAQPQGGEQTFEMTKRFVRTGLYDVWTVDSLHACIPESVIDIPIGSAQARAALARLLSEALPVLEHVVAQTHCVLILVNHMKVKPGVQYGREWYTPGGSAPEYYSSIRLRVWASTVYKDKKTGLRIGHKVKVKVEASKVAAPHRTAEYDLFYKSGKLEDGREVQPGIDLGSNWLSVLQEEGRIAKSSNGQMYDTESGKAVGTESEVIQRLEDPTDELTVLAHDITYPVAYRKD